MWAVGLGGRNLLFVGNGCLALCASVMSMYVCVCVGVRMQNSVFNVSSRNHQRPATTHYTAPKTTQNHPLQQQPLHAQLGDMFMVTLQVHRI